MGGPFKANWVKGESLEPGKFCRRSPRDTQIFTIDFKGPGICKYLSIKAW